MPHVAEIARKAAQIKMMRKLEKQAMAQAAKEARKQQGRSSQSALIVITLLKKKQKNNTVKLKPCCNIHTYNIHATYISYTLSIPTINT